MVGSKSPNIENVFLSYSRADNQAATALRSELEKAGISVFRDEDSIRIGDNWMERLQSTLQGCSAFVLLIGRDGVQRWIGAEVQVALVRNLSPHNDTQRLPIFPIVLPEGDTQHLPPFLSLFQMMPWQVDKPLPNELIQAIHNKLELLDKTIRIEGCPFLGLSAFQPEHAHLFFGRRRETLEAIKYLGIQREVHPDRIQDGEHFCRWLQIEGNSGAGKSSLVNAGMLPLIEQGALWSRTNYPHWKILGPMMPGEKPLQRLAELLEHSLISDPDKRDTLNRYQQLQHNNDALALRLIDFKQKDTAFLLVVDQFEELFTFSDPEEKQHFDTQLATALQNKDCPLFLISTVRIDFLEGFEQLSQLSELYNNHCKRYLLKTISRTGLREAIEQPAQLAGLNVSEITTAMLRDAQDEVGALPLVENALNVLWQHRKADRLSGALYEQKGGMAGLLEEQADTLLQQLDSEIPNGRQDALELLLALTRINDEGRHTRRRLPLGEAQLIAGGKKSDVQRGQQIIDYLTGRISPDGSNRKANGHLRLLTTVGNNEHEQSIDLIHETLIRARGTDKTSGKLFGYWKTLYNYIEKNRDRGFYRDQLTRQAQAWQTSKRFSRWRKLASWRDLKHYKKLRPETGSVDAKYKRWSQRIAWLQGGLLALLLTFVGESYLWTLNHGMPPSYMLMQQKFRLMNWGLLAEPLPELSDKIPASKGEFQMGELDKDFIETVNSQPDFKQNFGVPSTTAEITEPFYMGKYEVSYKQYDYYVWQQQKSEKPPEYPGNAPSENQRGQRAVVNVNWNDANSYLKWLSDKTGDHYRLPTEAEWEYAARAGTTTTYWWGDESKKGDKVMANCEGCGSQWDNKRVAPIGSFTPNDFGLYDTAGNVFEWTCSEWQKEFDGSESHCLEPDNKSGQRVYRGGSWYTKTGWLRSSSRSRNYSDTRFNNVGFRIFRAARTD